MRNVISILVIAVLLYLLWKPLAILAAGIMLVIFSVIAPFIILFPYIVIAAFLFVLYKIIKTKRK